MTRREMLAADIERAVAEIPHDGDMGQAIEEVLRDTLREYIPRRFDVGHGTVRSLDRPDWTSPSIDILFTHGDTGVALSTHPNTKVFPLESVLGFMEVTKSLDKEKLREDFKRVRELKHQVNRYCLASLSRAQEMGLDFEDICRKNGLDPAKAKALSRNIRVVAKYNDLEPRYYYFAYATDWKHSETICQSVHEVSTEFDVHLHGLLILTKGYYTHAGSGVADYQYVEDLEEAFSLFVHSLVDSLMTFVRIPEGTSIPLNAYFGSTGIGLRSYSAT